MRFFRLLFVSGDSNPYPGYNRYLVQAVGSKTTVRPVYIKVVAA